MLTTPRPAVIIAGSRSFGSGVPNSCAVSYVADVVADANFEIGTVVSGGARGADTYGEHWATREGIPVERFSVTEDLWERHGNQAAYYRNLAMAYVADRLIAIWDGRSAGTRMMIELAEVRLGANAVHIDRYRRRRYSV